MSARLPSLGLDNGWTCDYFELEPGLYELMTAQAVPSLAAWSFDRRRVDNWAAWLQRSFTLEPVDMCINYALLIDSAPAGTEIHVNGRQAGVYMPSGLDEPPYEVDVTLLVALGENRIAFRVPWDAEGVFSGVRLQPVPCQAG